MVIANRLLYVNKRCTVMKQAVAYATDFLQGTYLQGISNAFHITNGVASSIMAKSLHMTVLYTSFVQFSFSQLPLICKC